MILTLLESMIICTYKKSTKRTTSFKILLCVIPCEFKKVLHQLRGLMKEHHEEISMKQKKYGVRFMFVDEREKIPHYVYFLQGNCRLWLGA